MGVPVVTGFRAGVRRGRLGAADAGLASVVVAVVGLMIVPLPTWLLDLLISANLASSVAILLIALYVSDALKIAAFPTLLLLSTLVRLALNVSSTRLILLQADAGEVIRAFGQFVVRGNYVVGGIVFLILNAIQFIVIAKGSERVAEVGARFALDALPGKQLAIDAELRAGAIDGDEARRRRRTLARENQFYGAMDGAMKFVKGDVLASFLITSINLVGGLAIGVGMNGMDVVGALKRYGLLTIGDGLVTQIPSLVIATAAGVLVTRVASDEADTALGEELAGQILGAPRALRVAGLFICGLGLVPGLPALPFLAIGGVLLVTAHAAKSTTGPSRNAVPPELGHAASGIEASDRFIPCLEPWSLAVSLDLEVLIRDEGGGRRPLRPGLGSATEDIREILFRDLGVPLPPARVHAAPDLPPRKLLLNVHELPAGTIELPADADRAAAREFAVADAIRMLRPRAAEFVGLAETQRLLDELDRRAPGTVRQVVPKPLSVPLLADVLRRLLKEQVSIRDLKSILEALAQPSSGDQDSPALVEQVRSRLRRAITHDLTAGSSELPVILLDGHIEQALRAAISRTARGHFLNLPPAAARDIVSAVRRAVEAAPFVRGPRVLLSQPDIRRFVPALLEPDLPELRVISFTELLPEVTLKPLGTASLASG